MAESNNPPGLDELLLPLVRAQDQAEEDQILSTLIHDHIDPVIRAILRSKFSNRIYLSDQARDIRSEVILRLYNQLSKIKSNAGDKIRNLRGFVATITNRVCNDQIRAAYPNRSRLKNRTWYVLTRDSSFFIQEGKTGKWICGLKEWQSDSIELSKIEVEELLADPKRFQVKKTGDLPGASSLRTALTQLFSFSGKAVDAEDVVELMARLFHVSDLQKRQEQTDTEVELDHLADSKIDALGSLETAEFLKKLWSEIRELPVRQRAALLLNLKDREGKELVSSFPAAGVTTFREIANVLEIAPDQFVSLWKDLPLEDLKIAEILGVTRQQVINFRKSARERLLRRLKVNFF